MPADSHLPPSARRRWPIVGVLVAITALVALAVLAIVSGRSVEEPPTAAPTLVPERERPAADGDPALGTRDDAAPSAVAALGSVVLPTDAEDLLAVLEDMPEELAGRSRVPDQPDGEVLYANGGERQLFVVVMEAADMGVRDETNPELLETEARRAGRTVTAQETDPSAHLLYVAGTEEAERLHFLLWTTPDNPLVFAAVADSAAHLDELLRAFADATR